MFCCLALKLADCQWRSWKLFHKRIGCGCQWRILAEALIYPIQWLFLLMKPGARTILQALVNLLFSPFFNCLFKQRVIK